jgi:hypothetical protein
MTVPSRGPQVPTSAIPTFLGAPIGDVEDLCPGDVGMVGLFLDHGARGRFGQRFAARQIRYASAAAGLRPPCGPRGRCLDLGDLNVFPLQPVKQEQALRRQVELIMETGATPIIVGGRSLPFSLGACLTSGRTLHVGGDSIEASDDEMLGLLVDVAPLCDVRASNRSLTALLSTLRCIPAERIGAVHVSGVAPDLDVGGRFEASLAMHVLEALTAHCIGGRLCR